MIRCCMLIAATALAMPTLAAERRFDLAGFDRVAVGGSDNVVIRHGAGYSVIATGAQADLDRLDIKVERGSLGIGRKSGNWNWSSKDVTIAVTLPTLRGVSLGGSAAVQADRGDGDVFDMKLGGSGDLMIGQLQARTVNLALSGSGNAKASGQCGALNLRLAGSGDVDVSGLACTNADIRVAGSGDVLARASGQANISVAGSGDVTVTGGAKCTKRVAGSGDVVCR
jgi:hypothetical protein